MNAIDAEFDRLVQRRQTVLAFEAEALAAAAKVAAEVIRRVPYPEEIIDRDPKTGEAFLKRVPLAAMIPQFMALLDAHQARSLALEVALGLPALEDAYRLACIESDIATRAVLLARVASARTLRLKIAAAIECGDFECMHSDFLESIYQSFGALAGEPD